MATWPAAQAKDRIDDLVREAHQVGPQTLVSESGIVIVVSLPEWERRNAFQSENVQKQAMETHPGQSLAEFLLASPLAGSGIEIERIKGNWRELEL